MTVALTEYELAATDALRETPVEQHTEALGARLISEFHQAKLDRRDTEMRWLSDLRQYRGVYEPEEEAAMGANRSRAYIRKTRVKVKTVNSRVADLLFPAGSEKNWSISETPVPSLSEETLTEIRGELSTAMAMQAQAAAQQMQQQAEQMAAQGQPSPPMQPVGAQPVTDDMVKAAAKERAKIAAGKMSTTIEDQLAESRYKKASITAINSGHLYGTGILKGPLVERRVRTKFGQVGRRWQMKSETYVVPFVESTPIWNFYPDMAATDLEDCRYVYELHRMTKAKLADLAKRKSFDKKKIVDYLVSNPRGAATDDYFDVELKMMGDRQVRQGANRDQYDVIERWGYVDGDELKQIGVPVPDDRLHESFFANVWLLPNGTVIKSVLQPINGVTWPYHIYYFDKDETSFFGEGLASVMRDDVKMLNAAVRMILDNGALTSGPMLEVNVDMLASTDRADEVYPWKVFLRKRGADANVPAVRAIQLPNSLGDLLRIAQMFEQNTDETTAIPRYMSGENATQGAAGTAAGMSMLMAAANIVIKDLINAWDEGITKPFLEALYRWNMQFNRDPTIKGDFDVKARGAASLVAKEVRAQQLDAFSNATANELDAPYIKRDRMLRQRAEAHELSDVVKTEEEVEQEQQSEESQQLAAMQKSLAEAEIAINQAKASKLVAEAELTNKRADEVLANIELLVARKIDASVAAVYAALQGGGVVATNPTIAPAADEILRSAGWVDATPNPTIAQLGGPPVQPGQQSLPTPGIENPATTTNEVPRATPEMAPAGPVAPNLKPQTGMVGVNAGIETARVD